MRRSWGPTELTALREGEPAALDRLYREHVRTVLGWVIRLGGPGLDAEDLTQDVFGVAFRRCGSYRADALVTTWLYGITRNVVANARRRYAFRRFFGLEDEHADPVDGPAEALEQLGERRLVQLALADLPLAKREVVVLIDLEGRPAAEVAELLGVPLGTVYSRVHHAREALGAALERRGYDARSRA